MPVIEFPVVHEERYDHAASELVELFVDLLKRDPELNPKKLLDITRYWLIDDGLITVFEQEMGIGAGIAVAGWFLAFVWACTVSENTAAGVVIFGLIAIVLRNLRS